MTEEERIKQVFQDFEDGGLVSKDIDKVLRCISDQVIGIGIGEQGFVISKEDIRTVFTSGLREDDPADYSLEFDKLHILVHGGSFANACGEITITRTENGVLTQSKLLQTLVFTKEEGDWKICGLHASVPVVTENNINAYPLKVAEKILRSLREEIGEKAYLAEEQFQKAILADTIAFYIVNFSKNRFEKCQADRDICAYTEPGTPYEEFVLNNIQNYLSEADRERFLMKFSLKNIQEAIEKEEKELRCEYILRRSDGTPLWVVTVIRLIVDCITGDQKGIMYVRDIDRQKRREIEMQTKAECDNMTGFYHKISFAREVDAILSGSARSGVLPSGTESARTVSFETVSFKTVSSGTVPSDTVPSETETSQPASLKMPGIPGAFLMLDVDGFKTINDTFGHPFGDKVLIAAADLLKEQFKENSILGRLGGDEFGIFITGKTVQELTEGAVKELMVNFGRIRLPGQMDFPISCSIGISSSQNIRSFEQLYQQADEALYRSKQEGKNRCTVYESI